LHTRYRGLQNASMNLHHDLIEFRQSSIQGLGGFAIVSIRAGTRIIEYQGERIDKQRSLERCIEGNHFIFHLDDAWDLDGNVDWNPARLLNHSCAPSCEAELIDGRIWIVARRDLSAGEEITFNYNYDLDDYADHPCRCGSAACVGFIVAEELFDHVRARTIAAT
jgi:SET domain-containing protein